MRQILKKTNSSLYNNGKPLADINREYGIAKSTIKHGRRYNDSGSFNIDDNRTEEEERN